MFIVPIKSRFKSEPAPDNPKAISRGGKSRAELQVFGERMRYEDRELSAKDVSKLSANEFLWFETFFPQRLADAEKIENNKQHNKETMKVADARRMWAGKATDDESAAAQAAGAEFANRYPGFVRHSENAGAITRYMQQHDLDATQVPSYAEAFSALAIQGAVTISPRDAGIGPEARLTDPQEIKSYPKLHLVLQPSRVSKPEDKLSAEEYRKLNPELFGDNRVPPLIQARIARKQATEEFLKRTESATDSGSITRLIDYKAKG